MSAPVAFFFDNILEDVCSELIGGLEDIDIEVKNSKLESKETLSLFRNYYGIKNPKVRQNVHNLLKPMNEIQDN